MSDPENLASPPILDVERLLAPIPGDSPAGRDLRGDDSPTSPYYAIKDARNAARTVERQALLDPTVEATPDWSPVLKLAPDLLATKSKDLEIVAWFVEALVRKHGFAGLRDGFRLARELCTRYWDSLHPMPDEEGVATRVAPLTGLNGDDAEGTLVAPIRAVPLTDPSGAARIGVWEYEKAVELEKLADPDERQRRLDAGAITMREVEAAVKSSGAAFYRSLAADLAAAREELAALGAVLDEKCGASAPPSSNLRAAFEKVEDTLRFVAKDYLAAPAAEGAGSAAAAAGGTAGATAGGGGPGGPRGPLASREDAFRQLESVAEFFRRTEPHSPLSYSLEQAIRWGRMSLPDLLAEVVPDEAARYMMFRLTGIKPPQPPAEGGGAAAAG